MKELLGFGPMEYGDGIAVLDFNLIENNDFKTVAHIEHNRHVHYYSQNLTEEAIERIEFEAMFCNIYCSHPQPFYLLREISFMDFEVCNLKMIFKYLTNEEIEVMHKQNKRVITVFSSRDACETLARHFHYWNVKVKQGKNHWMFTITE